GARRAAALPRVPRSRDRAPPLVPRPRRREPPGAPPLRRPHGPRHPLRRRRRPRPLPVTAMASGFAIWITGLPGSGKSVLARAAAEALRARGVPVQVLELDAIRKILTPDPTYTDHERE